MSSYKDEISAALLRRLALRISPRFLKNYTWILQEIFQKFFPMDIYRSWSGRSSSRYSHRNSFRNTSTAPEILSENPRRFFFKHLSWNFSYNLPINFSRNSTKSIPGSSSQYFTRKFFRNPMWNSFKNFTPGFLHD